MAPLRDLGDASALIFHHTLLIHLSGNMFEQFFTPEKLSESLFYARDARVKQKDNKKEETVFITAVFNSLVKVIKLIRINISQT